MDVGKMVSQGAHASMKVLVCNEGYTRIKEWLGGSFTKVVVKGKNENQMMKAYEKAKENGVLAEYIIDEGRTVFDGTPALTAVAIGPDTDENLKPITKRFNLL